MLDFMVLARAASSDAGESVIDAAQATAVEALNFADDVTGLPFREIGKAVGDVIDFGQEMVSLVANPLAPLTGAAMSAWKSLAGVFS